MNSEGKKKKKTTLYYGLFDIYPLHINEVDMNKKANVSLICGGVRLKSKS